MYRALWGLFLMYYTVTRLVGTELYISFMVSYIFYRLELCRLWSV